MQSSLLRFIDVLRSHALPISPAETLDAAAAMDLVGYGDRQMLRDALAVTLAKSAREEETFRSCFDRFFDQQASDFSDVNKAKKDLNSITTHVYRQLK